ncbi:MAG TPA: hypothetical protein ENI80_12300 [Acidiferrobacteraceae bacterium]|nr:hypothetical protein [Acidiferrobacteraceae bacterium]
MPIQSEIDKSQGIVFTTIYGSVTDAEAFEHEKELRDREEFRAHFNQLVDARGVIENRLSADGLAKLGKVTPFDLTAKRACVVNDELAGLFAVIFGVQCGSRDNYYITKDIVYAYEWLGV